MHQTMKLKFMIKLYCICTLGHVKLDGVGPIDNRPSRHHNRITGSKTMVILLNGWIFSIGQSGEASWRRVCYQQGLPDLVSKRMIYY